MKKTVLIVLALVLIMPLTSFAKKKAKDIMGIYDVKGFNPGVSTSGTPNYKGTLEITQSGGAYMLKWFLETPQKKKTYNGVGIFSDGILSVGYPDGVVSYKVEKDILKGVWAPLKGGKFGFEIAEKMKSKEEVK